MRSPLILIMPSTIRHCLILMRVLCLVGVSLWGSRYRSCNRLIKSLSKLFPSWFLLIRGRCQAGVFLSLIRLSLIPLRTIGLHFPLLGVGIRASIWITIISVGVQFRSLQLKNEFLSNRTVSIRWIIFSVLVETVSWTVRAFTLGARLRINVIIGRILHRVVGRLRGRGMLLVLCLFEVIVVTVQSYVFILLISLYSIELE